MCKINLCFLFLALKYICLNICLIHMSAALAELCLLDNKIDQFRYIKIQPKTIVLITRFWGINIEFVGFIPQSLVLRSIVLG